MRRYLQLFTIAILLISNLMARPQSLQTATSTSSSEVHYRTVMVDGVSIFYREAGPKDASTLLLLHGFPSSSRMFNPLFARLSDQFHLVAPDYPGFGHSDHPTAASFEYTFDHLAVVMDHFVKTIGLQKYSIYMQDYGGPVGFRLAIAHPERLQSLIVQNAVAHEDGLGPLWAARREFWADRKAHEDKLRANFISLQATKQRHLGTDPDPSKYDPDLWTDEVAFLSQPGMADIQSDLFYDYRTNVRLYPAWQTWLREKQPPLLVLWGEYDPSFQAAEASAYQRDVKSAQVLVLKAGHFALDTEANSIADAVRRFLNRKAK